MTKLKQSRVLLTFPDGTITIRGNGMFVLKVWGILKTFLPESMLKILSVEEVDAEVGRKTRANVASIAKVG